MRTKTILLGLLFCLTLSAQGVIDEVIWVVGDEAILRSEVEEERLRALYEGTPIPGDPYCYIPEQMAVQKLFLHQAALDSVEANESSVSHQVDMRLNYYINQIGSKEKMEEYFRKTSSEIREEMMTSVRNQMIIQQMQAKLTADIKPTPSEIRRYYQSLPIDSLPMMPAQVEVQIISFEPPVPIEETERIKQRLREFTERVQNGSADFSMLARLYSEDTESAKRGGELGFVGKGQLVPEFAEVAFNLNDPKRVSRIVQTEYGYHIIQLIEKKGERINCRHILLRPRISTIKNIIVNVHRLLLTLCHRHINNHNDILIVTNFIGLHIIFRQQINAYLLGIVHIIPKFLAKLRCILETGSSPTTIFVFFDTKNDNSTIAVCKGRICVPQRNRQTTFCFFHFSSVVFSVFIKL